MIKARGLIVLLLAAIAAYLAAGLSSRYFKATAPAGKPAAVAGIDIPSGEPLTGMNVTFVNWPPDQIPEGTFSRIEAVRGWVAATDIKAGELIRKHQLTSDRPEPEDDTPGRVDPGMRLIRLSLPAAAAVGGMLSPGDHVDVIAAGPLKEKEKHRKWVSRTLLSRIKVVEVAGKKSGAGLSLKSSKKVSVALQVTVGEACILAAAEKASLSLVKRDSRNEEDSPGDVVFYSAELGPKTLAELNRMVAARNRRLQKAIRPGYRAVTIRVSDEDGICGLLQPGQHVDIVATHGFIGTAVQGRRTPGSEATVTGNWKASKILMQNLEILFIEEDVALTNEARYRSGSQKTNPPDGSNQKGDSAGEWVTPWPTKRVTVLVLPEDAELLTVIADTSETVKLIVRKSGDTRITETTGEKSTEVFYKDKDLYHDITILKRGLDRERRRFDRESLEAPDQPARFPRLKRDMEI